MASTREDEYEAQLLGFSCRDFMLVVRSDVADLVADHARRMGSSLKKRVTSGEEAEVDRRVEVLINEYKKAAEKPLHTLEQRIPDYFGIPPHVVLPENFKNQDANFSQEFENKLRVELEQLKMRAQKAKVLEARLTEELEQAETLSDIEKKLQHVTEIVNQMQDGKLPELCSKSELFDLVKSIQVLEKRVADLDKLDWPLIPVDPAGLWVGHCH